MQNPYRAGSQVNPKTTNGHREIENGVFKAIIAANLSGGEYKVALFILDQTIGWDRESHLISLSQYIRATFLSKQAILDAIYNLERKRIICTERNGTKGTAYLFNQHYDMWDVPSASLLNLTSIETPLVKQSRQGLSSRVDKSSQVEQTSTCLPRTPATEPLKKDKETIKETIKDNSGSSPNHAAETDASKFLFEKTNRKRWPNLVQKEEFESAEKDVGSEKMIEAVKWALTSGIANIKSIITTAKRRPKNDQPQLRIQSHKEGSREPTAEELRASVRRKPG